MGKPNDTGEKNEKAQQKVEFKNAEKTFSSSFPCLFSIYS